MKNLFAAILVLLLAGQAHALTLTGFGGSDLTVPVNIFADAIENSDADTVEARGNVRVVWGARTLDAMSIVYRKGESSIEAKGEVKINDADAKSTLTCDFIKLNLEDNTAEAKNASLFMEETGYRVKAKVIRRTGPNLFEAEEAVFTACDGTFPSWSVEAGRIKVEIEGYLFGANGLMYVESLPVIYLPYFVFPAKIKRQSGFLTPKVGHSSKDGFIIDQRYYWAVNESLDVVIEGDYRTNLGLAEEILARYAVSGDHIGEVRVRHYPRTKDTGTALDVGVDHIGNLWDLGTLDIQIDYTGDKASRIDYAQDIILRNLSRVESHASFSGATDPGSYYLFGRYSQAFSEDQDGVLQSLPAVGFLGSDFKLLGPLYSRTDAQSERLSREEGLSAERLRLSQGLLTDVNFYGFGLTFGGGYRWNIYNIHDSGGQFDDSVQHGAAWLESTLWTGIEGDLLGYLHTIEPRIRLRWEEEGRGDEVPIFDDNDLFLGKRTLSLGLETRLYDRDLGDNFLLLNLERGVDLGGQSADKASTWEWGAWRGEIGLNPFRNVTFHADGEFLPASGWNRWSVEATGGDRRGDKVGFKHQYVADFSSYLESFLQAELLKGWGVSYLNRYSLRDKRLLEDEIKLLYRHQCWQAALTYSRSKLIQDDEFDRVVMLSVSLIGLGKVGRMEW